MNGRGSSLTFGTTNRTYLFLDTCSFLLCFDGVYSASKLGNDELLAIFFVYRLSSSVSSSIKAIVIVIVIVVFIIKMVRWKVRIGSRRGSILGSHSGVCSNDRWAGEEKRKPPSKDCHRHHIFSKKELLVTDQVQSNVFVWPTEVDGHGHGRGMIEGEANEW